MNQFVLHVSSQLEKKLKMVIANLILVIVSYLGQFGLLILAHFLYYPTH